MGGDAVDAHTLTESLSLSASEGEELNANTASG